MKEMYFSIDCYQCGTKLKFPFRLFDGHADYCYCPDCGEGIQVYFVGENLSIDRLEALGEK